MKVKGKIIYSLSFEYDMGENMFNDTDCKDTGYVNDWILNKIEEDVGLNYNDMFNLKDAIRQRASKDAIIDISRDDVIVYGLVENVKYLRDKYNIPSDGICDRC